jgi:hypothetical protein
MISPLIEVTNVISKISFIDQVMERQPNISHDIPDRAKLALG